MPSSVKLYIILVTIGMALCDGIFWLRVVRKQSGKSFEQLFAAVTLLLGVIVMTIIIASNR